MSIEHKRCLVTGAGGFIGRALCASLAAADAQVIGLDIDRSARQRVLDTGAEFALCDTTDPQSVRDALAQAQVVVHTAALVSDWGPMDAFVRVNVRGTKNVLDGARAAGAERVVHVSSVAIWGYEHRHDLDDDAPPRPCGIPYVDTKGASDALALGRARAGEPIVVVRPGDVYGPGSVPWAIRPLEAIKHRRFVLVDGGRGLMTPIYVDDLVEAMLRALTRPEAVGRSFTVWNGHAVTCADFFSYYARMLGRDRLPRLPRHLAAAVAAAEELAARLTGGLPASGRPPTFTRNAITFVTRKATYSSHLARDLLSWEPKVTLDEGMRRTEAWFREEGLL